MLCKIQWIRVDIHKLDIQPRGNIGYTNCSQADAPLKSRRTHRCDATWNEHLRHAAAREECPRVNLRHSVSRSGIRHRLRDKDGSAVAIVGRRCHDGGPFRGAVIVVNPIYLKIVGRKRLCGAESREECEAERRISELVSMRNRCVVCCHRHLRVVFPSIPKHGRDNKERDIQTKSAGIFFSVTRPVFKGSRITHQTGTSNARHLRRYENPTLYTFPYPRGTRICRDIFISRRRSSLRCPYSLMSKLRDFLNTIWTKRQNERLYQYVTHPALAARSKHRRR